MKLPNLWGILNGTNIMKMYYFYKLCILLRKWETRYVPSEYDHIIKSAFAIIDLYNLNSGEKSPSFSLLNSDLGKDFIVRFFKAAPEHGYVVISHEFEEITKFNFIRKCNN
jgi:hypothetical protein